MRREEEMNDAHNELVRPKLVEVLESVKACGGDGVCGISGEVFQQSTKSSRDGKGSDRRQRDEIDIDSISALAFDCA